MITKTYDEIRPSLNSGDYVLYKGDAWYSHIIRAWSDYSHAAMIVRFEEFSELRDRLFIAEMVWDGASRGRMRLGLLSDNLENAYIVKVMKTEPEVHKFTVLTLAILAQDPAYDAENLFGQSVRKFIGPAARMDQADNKMICSELVFNLHADVRGLPIPRKTPRPGELPRLLGGQIVRVSSK